MCCFHLSSLSQTLPKIDLNNYSVVPVDEGDEDGDIDSDDDAAGSDLDLDLGDGDSEEGLAHMTERITCDMSDIVGCPVLSCCGTRPALCHGKAVQVFQLQYQFVAPICTNYFPGFNEVVFVQIFLGLSLEAGLSNVGLFPHR